MRKLIFILVCALATCSQTQEGSEGNDFIVGPRQRSSTEFKRNKETDQNDQKINFDSPPKLINPDTLKASKSSPTSIVSVLSVDNFPASTPQHFRPLFIVNPVLKIDGSTLGKNRFVPPNRSPIIEQFNIIDKLMESQFEPVKEPKNLMAGHMAVLKNHCRTLVTRHGPLHPKSRNCSLRYHESIRFLQLLAKYKTGVSEYRQGAAYQYFCANLAAHLKKLKVFVSTAVREYTTIIETDPEDARRLNRALTPYQDEFKELQAAMDAIDFDLLVYCDRLSEEGVTMQMAMDAVSKYISLAFL